MTAACTGRGNSDGAEDASGTAMANGESSPAMLQGPCAVSVLGGIA